MHVDLTVFDFFENVVLMLGWIINNAFWGILNKTMIAALPCQTNYQYIRTQLNNTAIQDPKLREEVAHFQVWCYGAARAKLLQTSGAISRQRAEDTDWLGSSCFLNTPGYYDSIQSKGPIKGFAYNAQRDSGRGTRPNQGGYPMCKQ